MTSTETEISADTIKVMIADDSSVVRGLVTRAIESNPLIKVVTSVSDGQMAVNSLARHPVDVIILDVEMPVMDGLTAIPKLLAVNPNVRIIIASTLSIKNAEVSLRAIELGAADYIAKPTAREISGAMSFKDDLIAKITVHGTASRAGNARRRGDTIISPASGTKLAAPTAMSRPPETDKITLRPMPQTKPELIAIGSSTGGPQALFNVIKTLGTLPQPVIITQHMPPNFTTILAEHISRQCSVTCVEARDGMELEGGVYYIAPGDYHMLPVKRIGRTVLTLNQDPHENFCRPAVDPMLRAASAIYGSKLLTVILTGMGQDGWKGSEAAVAAGGAIIAQDEASSVVWGMPAAVARAGLCSAVLPLNDIGGSVRRIAQGAPT